jgi:hypothetical protein
MRRSRTAILVFAVLVLAGCAGGTDAPDAAAADPPATTVPGGGSSETTTSTIAPVPTTRAPAGSVTTTAPPDDRPVAPDFSLELGAGGTFVLSEETRPVFMVFWAEW